MTTCVFVGMLWLLLIDQKGGYVPMIGPRWEVKIGSPVLTTDGEYGRLEELILDPDQERVVALLVQQHGLVFSHIVVVPEEEVADATDSQVRLKISREQADALPEYTPQIGLVVGGRKYEVDDVSSAVRGTHGIEVGPAPAAQQPGMIESQFAESGREDLALRVRAGDRVFCRDGHAGRVSLILLDPRGRVQGLVMHTGHLPGRNLIVPVAWVAEISWENVYLSVEKWVLESLPDYRPDDALAADVDNALWADDILRMGDYHVIDVTVQDGIVRLRGHVVTPVNKSRAEDAARSVAGVLGVENHLVVDDDLVTGVAQALGREDRTRFERVDVGARNGFIFLSGQVASAAVREAAEEVAASVPQVRVIMNLLQAPNVVVDPQEQQVLEPPIGREIYATQERLGHVERVIINPHNRRVTAFVAHGYFPDLLHMDERRVSNEVPQQERRVVVPIRVVRYGTGSSVLLNVDSCEAARYRDFDSADFVSPPEGWQPPYPYRWDDVLFERRA